VLSVTPLSQVYVFAPLPVKVILSPKQITVLVTLAAIVGNSLTSRLTLADCEHPFESVPITVYVKGPAEVGVKSVLSITPLSQVYESAPLPLNITLSPI